MREGGKGARKRRKSDRATRRHTGAVEKEEKPFDVSYANELDHADGTGLMKR